MDKFQAEWGEFMNTLWWTNIAIENGHLYIVDFTIKNGDFPLLC